MTGDIIGVRAFGTDEAGNTASAGVKTVQIVANAPEGNVRAAAEHTVAMT